jgi:hypothetical protein
VPMTSHRCSPLSPRFFIGSRIGLVNVALRGMLGISRHGATGHLFPGRHVLRAGIRLVPSALDDRASFRAMESLRAERHGGTQCRATASDVADCPPRVACGADLLCDCRHRVFRYPRTAGFATHSVLSTFICWATHSEVGL